MKHLFLQKLGPIVLMFGLTQACAPTPSHHVLPNGFFDQEEWAEADLLCDEASVTCHVLQDAEHLFFGIQFGDVNHSGLDLYLADGVGTIKRLHISTALSEADFDGAAFSNEQWEQNQRWTANKLGLYVMDGARQFSTFEGFEFQLDKAMLDAPVWYVAFHLKRPDVYHPPTLENALTDADFTQSADWVAIRVRPD